LGLFYLDLISFYLILFHFRTILLQLQVI